MKKPNILFEHDNDITRTVVLNSSVDGKYLKVEESTVAGSVLSNVEHITEKEFIELQDNYPDVRSVYNVEKKVASIIGERFEDITYNFELKKFFYKGKQLRIQYSPELVENLLQYNSVDAITEIVDLLTEYLKKEIENNEQ